MTGTDHRTEPRFFYGWVVVGTVFVTLGVTAGLGFYNASVILRIAVDDLDASVSAVSGATAVFFGVSGFTGFALSRQMERVDLRWFYLSGGIIGAVALASLRWVDSIVKLYAFFALFGVAFALAGLVPATTLVARWFDRRRSVALSIASTGLSFGGIAITPVAAGFTEDRGLAGAGPWLGLAWLIGVVPIAVLLIRSHPEDMGVEPDGAPAPPEPVPLEGATFEEAATTRFFGFIAATYAVVFLAQVGAMAQLFNLVAERVDSGTAAAALSALAFASVVGRLAGGVIVTRVSTQGLTAALIAVQVVALAMIAFADTRASLLVAAAVLGLSVGNVLMLQPLLLAETFGVKEYSRIYSFNQLVATIGVASGPFVLGVLHDLYDYEIAFLAAAAINLVGLGLLIMAGPIAEAIAVWHPAPVESRPEMSQEVAQ